jgi:hypothetical protein
VRALQAAGTINIEQLRAALTTFPRARTVALRSSPAWVGTQREALVDWLKEGGRGRYLERVTSVEAGAPAEELVHEALRRTALPSLKRVAAHLQHPTQRVSLSWGLIPAIHELQLTINFADNNAIDPEDQITALGFVWKAVRLGEARAPRRRATRHLLSVAVLHPALP